MALLCIAPPLITAQPYPVDVNMGSSTPRRFNIFQYWIEIKAYSSADIIVKAVIYVPRYGWSDWQNYGKAICVWVRKKELMEAFLSLMMPVWEA